MIIGRLLIAIVIAIVIFGLFIWGTLSLAKQSQKLHLKIDALENRARAALTKKELETIWEDMKIVNKECTMRPFGDRIRIVAAILEAKYHILSNK